MLPLHVIYVRYIILVDKVTLNKEANNTALAAKSLFIACVKW